MLTNNPILFYQVWNKSGSGNNSRFANEAYLNDFVKLFLDYNLKNQIKYAPTTLIDFDNSLHVLVMTNVKQDKKGRTIFYFSKNSVEIRNKIQLIDSKLPLGKFSNVRFDIDSINCEGCGADLKVLRTGTALEGRGLADRGLADMQVRAGTALEGRGLADMQVRAGTALEDRGLADMQVRAGTALVGNTPGHPFPFYA